MNNTINMGVRIKGEYRAKLYGSNGKLKSDSGWQPNTILDLGMYYLTTRIGGSPSSFTIFQYMYLGDGGAAVNVTQIGLQGSELGKHDSEIGVFGSNAGAPDYERISIRSYTFNVGTATGTIREFVFTPYNLITPLTNATVRVVLTTPIVKGASDVLTIEHRSTYYPEINDVVGVIDISGVAYNYIMRAVNIDAAPLYVGWHPRTLALFIYGTIGSTYAYTDDITVNTGNGPSATLGWNGGAVVNTDNGNTVGNWWANQLITAGVDVWNGNIRSFKVNADGVEAFYQIRLGKVSDDSPLTKLNTHEFTINVRTYPQRYP